jgi:hypothetical protein
MITARWSSRKLNRFPGSPLNDRISARGVRQSGSSCGPPPPTPIITPPKAGCQENAAMKASVAHAAGIYASPSGAALGHGCAHLIRDDHARQAPSRPPDHQLPIHNGHHVQGPNRDLRRFATVCKSGVDEAALGRECRHDRTVNMAAKAPAGSQDASSGSGRSKRGPARLKQNAAAGTRIGRDSGASELRIAICYGMRGFAISWDRCQNFPRSQGPATSRVCRENFS